MRKKNKDLAVITANDYVVIEDGDPLSRRLERIIFFEKAPHKITIKLDFLPESIVGVQAVKSEIFFDGQTFGNVSYIFGVNLKEIIANPTEVDDGISQIPKFIKRDELYQRYLEDAFNIHYGHRFPVKYRIICRLNEEYWRRKSLPELGWFRLPKHSFIQDMIQYMEVNHSK